MTEAQSNALQPLFNRETLRSTSLVFSTLGYRWVKVDYDKGDFLYDVRQEGIATGITFRF